MNVLLFFSPFIIILLIKLDITVVDACKSYWQFEETDSLTRFYYVLHEIPILLLEIYMIGSRFLLLIYIPSSGHHFESVVPLLQVIFSHLFETTGQNVLVTKLDIDVHWVAPVQHLYLVTRVVALGGGSLMEYSRVHLPLVTRVVALGGA